MNLTDNATHDEKDIVLFVQTGSQKTTFTMTQLRDTVASYLARGSHMPTPTDNNDNDPLEPLHIIIEEWLYGNVHGWTNSTDVVQLEKYRHHAMQWIRGYFTVSIPNPERDQS